MILKASFALHLRRQSSDSVWLKTQQWRSQNLKSVKLPLYKFFSKFYTHKIYFSEQHKNFKNFKVIFKNTICKFKQDL